MGIDDHFLDGFIENCYNYGDCIRRIYEQGG